MEGTKHFLWQACFFSVVEGFGLRVIIQFLGMSVMWRSCGKSLGIIPALIHVFRNYKLGILRQFPALRRSQQASSTKIGEQLPDTVYIDINARSLNDCKERLSKPWYQRQRVKCTMKYEEPAMVYLRVLLFSCWRFSHKISTLSYSKTLLKPPSSGPHFLARTQLSTH